MSDHPHVHSSTCGCLNEGIDSGQLESLYETIEIDKIIAYNEFQPNSAKKVFKSYSQFLSDKKSNNDDINNILRSNDDEPELLILIPFNTNVKIKSITIQASGETRPESVKLFINRDDLDIASAAEANPLETVQLKDDSEGKHNYMLKFHKFQSVHSMIMYFPSSVGGEVSEIKYISLKGISTKVNRSAPVVSYEAIPQPGSNLINNGESIAKHSSVE